MDSPYQPSAMRDPLRYKALEHIIYIPRNISKILSCVCPTKMKKGKRSRGPARSRKRSLFTERLWESVNLITFGFTGRDRVLTASMEDGSQAKEILVYSHSRNVRLRAPCVFAPEIQSNRIVSNRAHGDFTPRRRASRWVYLFFFSFLKVMYISHLHLLCALEILAAVYPKVERICKMMEFVN